ncbi:CRISPR-associated protein Csn2-St [Lactococcus nasutitermitis]|uniref:CRISPR-associated protein Csn2-St n=1 Tax=Lactococcus nasutitermitis TaxID=1652957 RepID=A0ABV9JFF0_9LACT|nr:CRISPR-associated protein Csn2-St [Lactococcus nasutitermitis]
MIKIELEDHQFIEFDEQNRLFFYGSNQQMRQQLIRSLKRFGLKKALNELEEVVYGENGLEIYRDNQLLNPKNIDFLFVQDNLSIYKEVALTKGSLMAEFLKSFGEEVAVNFQLEEIKNHLLEIELIFNEKLAQISNNISSNLTDLTFDDLLKNHVFLSYFDSRHDFPLEMMDANELLDEYVKLLSEKLMRHPKETWLILVNPASFLTSERIQFLLESLEQIAEETGLLKVWIISNQVLDFPHQLSDISGTIILASDAYQMPEFSDFRKSIENHYPEKLEMTDEVLCQKFYEIVSNIGIKPSITGKASRNMVLLKVIDELLGFDDLPFSVKFDELSTAEKSYLLSEN